MPDRKASIDVLRPRPEVAVVAVTGGHDLASAQDLVHTFEQLTAAGTSVVSDLSDLTFFDTTTVHALVVGRKLAAAARVGFVVRVPEQHPVARTLQQMRIVQLVPVAGTMEEAITATIADRVAVEQAS
jgi:anti-anti-sigma factor